MSFNPSRSSPGSSRLQFGRITSISSVSLGISRLRSSSTKKPPEPLRRAVADCLSSPSPTHHGGPSSSSTVTSEASRILRDYLAVPSTTDLAYSVIIEHTVAERERSPAVIARCVALLKRYLLRYRPGEETLQQIDRFCMSIVAECDPYLNRKSTQWSGSVNQSVSSSTSSVTNSSAPLPVSSFASATLIKSLNYVRSLVTQQHIPKRSFKSAAFAGTASASKHALPALSSMLKESFNSQLNPANAVEPSEGKDDDAALSSSNKCGLKNVDLVEDLESIALDVLKWRWLMEHQIPRALSESDHAVHPQDMNAHNFLEVGAAALLVGDMEAKMKGQPWKYFGTADMLYLEQLLQPSPVTTIASSSSSNSHLRAITTSKRTKAGPRQIWEEAPMSTFRPRARPLFQYRHYSEQQPLRLNPAEVCEVIAAVCSEASSPNTSAMTVSSKLTNNRKPSIDAAVSVLIKLVIDMYMLDSGIAAPLTLSMLQEMLCSSIAECRARAFDLILNLGVHAQLLEPVITDVTSTIEEEYSPDSYMDNEAQLAEEEITRSSPKLTGSSAAIVNFETWILNILHETLLFLVQMEEKEESVWASGLSCLFYFVCSRGKILRQRLQGPDIRVVKSLLEISRRNSWAEIVHCKLISMLTNMFYQLPSEPADSVSSAPVFLVDQVDLIGGIEFIFLEYSLANSREERRNLYLVLFDYVLHQIKETYLATGVSEYSDDEIQPLATLLSLVDAPEAFYISVKLGVQGLGEILRRSISDALSRYPNSERLNMLLEHIMERFDLLVSSYTHLDKEFSHMVQITKSFKLLRGIEEPFIRNAVHLYWSTLHSLLHSPRIGSRQNGYIWLSDLLISEISDRKDADIGSNIEILQQGIAYAGVTDLTITSDVPLPILLFCGLLKSKCNAIRWGFLFVLDRLLMRCKFLLDERRYQSFSSSHNNERVDEDSHLMKANAVIDIMSSALLLVYQINETDRINILEMCDILFSQVCLKVPPANMVAPGDESNTTNNNNGVGETLLERQNSYYELKEHSCENNSRSSSVYYSGTASMAALLLQGHAVVPMQLISRIPAALFYWPLIQLASAATDNIALGVAVGSKGRGNLPGAASDIRATLLLLLIGKCTVDPSAFLEVGGEEFFRELLDDTDSRVAYYSSAFLLKRMMTEKPEKYQHMLQNLVFKAQQSNNEKLLENPYLQMRGILQLANDLGIEL